MEMCLVCYGSGNVFQVQLEHIVVSEMADIDKLGECIVCPVCKGNGVVWDRRYATQEFLQSEPSALVRYFAASNKRTLTLILHGKAFRAMHVLDAQSNYSIMYFEIYSGYSYLATGS